jgi:beta-galactosidase
MFYFGVDYYPEHWPESRWAEDAYLMQQAGINIVRLAEFAWSRLEPEEGRYDFNWLDRAIGILKERGISAILGTPTASPPAWVMAKDHELFRVREDGIRLTYGNRREYCPSHPLYHELSHRIVSQMADHYAGNPAIVGWQIDNEFGDRCYCPVCQRAFQNWLRRRYQSLEIVNSAWGTVFWSHEYSAWEQIPTPAATGGAPNPGLALDYGRFISDTYVAYQQMQIDLLREKCPDHFITHNFMGFGYDGLNYYDLAQSLDLVSWDNYPRNQWSMKSWLDPAPLALGHDTMRGLKRQNFWMMEQQAGPGGWQLVSVAPRPGEQRLWAYQAIAHGADGMIFFRWRTARFGTEEYWHGLLDHDGTPGRRYQEIRRMGHEISQVGEVVRGANPSPRVAMLLSYDSRWAFQIQGNNPTFSYPDHFTHLYRAFHRLNIPVEIISPEADLTTFRLVIAPALHVVTPAVADNLSKFANAGGILALTPRSGVKEDANSVVNSRLPGLLASLTGATVKEYDSYSPEMRNSLEFNYDGAAASFTVHTWCDVLDPGPAEVVARYGQEYYAGEPAVTLNTCGKGKTVYVGTFGDDDFYLFLARWLAGLSGAQPLITGLPEGVEVTERLKGNQRLLFILNHTPTPQIIHLDGEYIELLSRDIMTGDVSIPGREVWILT